METFGGTIIEHTNKQTFLNHVFSFTEEGKAEVYNAVQYGISAIIPVVILNKTIQRFIPEPDLEKGSLEILVEIILQLVIIFVGIILIHRIITYVPTFSKYKYESLTLTNVILAFMIIVLSLQTKIGIKTNILYERVVDMWEGNTSSDKKVYVKRNEGFTPPVNSHSPSSADHLDSNPSGVFPPAPIHTGGGGSGGGGGGYKSQQNEPYHIPEPQPANFMGSLGSSF